MVADGLVPSLLLLEAHQLLADGRLRVTGVWARAADAVVLVLDGPPHLVRVRPRGWSCSCGAGDRTSACVHAVALRLVVGPLEGPWSEVPS
jgi:hypothetical protein